MTPAWWKSARKELEQRDPVLARIIRSVPRQVGLRTRGDSFGTLARSIVGQQISVKAADSVWTRLERRMVRVRPEVVARVSVDDLRACGLSARKVEYLRDLAAHFLDGRLDPTGWAEVPDEALIDCLVDVRGIGRWTAEMFLIFHLLRPNVFPADDLGLQKAISLRYGRRYPVSRRILMEYKKAWDPWNTAAVWYLWRSLDPVPVEY